MPVSIKGTGGGGVTLDAGAASTTTTLTLPNVTGTVLQSGTAVTVAQGGTGLATLTAANNALYSTSSSAMTAGTLPAAAGGTGLTTPGTSGNVLTSNGSAWVSSTPASTGITSGTAVASTSGTSIDFTGLPSTVKRVTVMLNQVSTNGSSIVQIQLGSGSVVTSGYQSDCAGINGGTGQGSATTGHIILFAGGASFSYVGNVVFTLQSTNTWVGTGISRYQTGGSVAYHTSFVTLSGALDRVRITTVNGTDTFDAGSINILYE
jgi:hypothetical protein